MTEAGLLQNHNPYTGGRILVFAGYADTVGYGKDEGFRRNKELKAPRFGGVFFYPKLNIIGRKERTLDERNSYEINGRSVHIKLLAVLPEYQGKGFGKALTNYQLIHILSIDSLH